MEKKSNTDLDREVVEVVQMLNNLSGVETTSSCSGHDYDDAYISLLCNNFESLLKIVEAVFSIRWKCGDAMDSKVHLWIVGISPFLDPINKGKLGLFIGYQKQDRYKPHGIKMKKAWNQLECSLAGVST